MSEPDTSTDRLPDLLREPVQKARRAYAGLSKLRGKKLALYNALLVAAPEPLPAMTLALILWPDRRMPADPLQNVRVHIVQLKALLAKEGARETVVWVERQGAPGAWRLQAVEEKNA
ncbi:hypothetical protein J8J14_22205 [Roseomonas sp. SSH11]|uniref:OmpR/PhoB-type domain-containing protein n=1 Tax=Pararoseomonas baculiformis TaxID=2820812 RepID=A0ABS4AKA1_9PROT|nr:hypothetical protein [Pararoseomonas baculiformis]MBP0447478.1 hypothetical protein [Pararoseomonas baculiformis]